MSRMPHFFVLLRQRSFAGVFRQPAGVLQAGLFVVTGDHVYRRLGGWLFHHILARDLHLTVILQAGAGRNQAAHDHVLLQAAEVINLAVDGGFGEHARGLLEGGRGNERIGGERCLRDAQQHGFALRRTAAGFAGFEILCAELELVDYFFRQEFGVADVFHLHPAHHLAGDDFQVLVVDVDALQTVDFLNLVDQVLLQFLFTEDSQDVVRVAGSVHERLAGFHALAFLDVDVHAAGQGILALFPFVALDIDFALALGNFAVLHDAVDLRDDGRLARLARFEQFHHARQTAGDVLRLGGFARDLGHHVAGVDVFSVAYHQVSVGRHEVLLGFRPRARSALRPDDHLRLPLLVGRIGDHELRHAGDFVHLLLQREAVDEVLEVDHTGDFGEDREGVRIPFEQDLVALHGSAVFHQDARAVYHRVALLFTALIVHHRHNAQAVHGDDFVGLAADRHDPDIAGESIGFGVLRGLLADSRGGSTDVEGTHGQLGAGFADGLRRDHADRFAAFHQASGGQVAAVAGDAHAALGFAGEHRADLDALDTGRLNGRRQVFGDLLVDAHDDVAFVILLILERHAADDAVAQRLDDCAGFDDRLHVNAFGGAAIVFADDHVLRHVDQAAREIAGIGRLQRRIGQTLAGAVRGDEVLQHIEAFAEVGGDGGFDDFAGGLGHQTAHTGELADLLFGTACAGVGHDVNGVEVAARAVVLFHGGHHLVGHALGDLRPDFDDLVVALAVGDGAVLILAFDVDHFLFGFTDQDSLLGGEHHVVDADGDARAGGVQEAQSLHFIQHLDGDLQAELEVAILHQGAQALLLQQAVDERHILRQVIVHDHATDGGFHVLLDELDGLGVDDVLAVEHMHQVDHPAGIAQLDGSERFHFAHFERDQHIVGGSEGAAFTLGAGARFGEVVAAQHHVLGGDGDRSAMRRRQNVVGREHQGGCFDLRFRRERDVDGHLVAVEVGVEGGAGQRVQLDGLAFDEYGLKRLNAETVQRGGAVEQNRMVLNDLFEDVPHHRILLLH